jgi:hypothetical protein
LSVPGVYSQKDIAVEQIKETMSRGIQTGFKVIVPQANLDKVKKAWAKQIQKQVKQKPVEVEHEMRLDGALAPEISPDPINIYSLLTDVDSSIHLVAFFELDSGMFFDPETYPDALVGDKIVNAIQNYMRRFAVEQYIVAVEDELKMEEDNLKVLEKELDGLKKDKERMEKSTKEEEQNITMADDEIKILKGQKEQQLKAIENKRVAMATVTDKEAKKAGKAELKALEKARNKADKQLEKEEKQKIESKNQIQENEDGIEKNLQEQDELLLKIEGQEAVVEKVKVKLAGIK